MLMSILYSSITLFGFPVTCCSLLNGFLFFTLVVISHAQISYLAVIFCVTGQWTRLQYWVNGFLFEVELLFHK